MGLRPVETGAHSGVVPAIKQAVGAVQLRIIEPAPGLAAAAGSDRLAGKQRRRPGAVVRLQTQFVVRVFGSQLLKAVRQPAAIDDPAHTEFELPKAEDCGE